MTTTRYRAPGGWVLFCMLVMGLGLATGCGDDVSGGDGGRGAGVGTGGTAAGGSGPFGSVTFVLVNGGNAQVRAQTQGCNGEIRWFGVSDASGSARALAEASPCWCDEYYSAGGCAGCPAVCQADEFQTLESGEDIRYEWDGRYISHDLDPNCVDWDYVHSGDALEVNFCWDVGEGTDVICAPVSFTFGQDTEVSYTVPAAGSG